jgi:ribosome-binding protein aMBF1 (putative translation factor)
MGQNDRTVSRATSALAASIREAQGKANMSTAALARASGVPYSTLRKIRKGDQTIDWEEVSKLATAMRVRSSVIAARAEEIEASMPVD